MSYWTGFNHFVVWGSIIYYFCFQLAFYSEGLNYTYVGADFSAYGLPIFWLIMLLTCTILIMPMVAWRFYQISVHPSLSDRVRLRQRMHKSKSRARDLKVRRHSTLRRSQRSIRSGYAFAHQAGFGELITSGINMKQRVQEDRQSPVKLIKVSRSNLNSIPPKGKQNIAIKETFGTRHLESDVDTSEVVTVNHMKDTKQRNSDHTPSMPEHRASSEHGESGECQEFDSTQNSQTSTICEQPEISHSVIPPSFPSFNSSNNDNIIIERL